QDRFVEGSLKLARCLDGKESLPWLTRLIERVPSVEEGYQLLMKRQYQGGDRALALRTFERCAENLSLELDVPVSPETERLYQGILAQADPHSL
ncbi:MAG: bacterial transcriptional activator domain-containing protein, partial [Bacteroidota bacterium]